MLSHFISWDGWLYMGPGRVRFQGEVEVSFDSRISCTWRVVVSPYLRHLFFILGKLSKYFLSFVFVTQLQPKTCRVFRERYMNDRSRNSHGKQLNLSNAKFRAVDSKPTLFITKFSWTFVSKRKFDEVVLFVQRKIRSKSLELSFELSHEISKKVRENCMYIYLFIYLFIYGSSSLQVM